MPFNHDEFLGSIKDILFQSAVDQMHEFPAHRLSRHLSYIETGRREHMIRVSFFSYLLAKKLHLDSVSCARAGMLHDIGYSKDATVLENMLYHPIRGGNIARKMGESKRVISIIESHMFPMGCYVNSLEGLIVWAMDKFDAILDFFYMSDGLNKSLYVKILDYKKKKFAS